MSYVKRDYNDPIYKAWRVKVFQRDKFKCQFPGCCNKTKIGLNAHHIIRWVDAPLLRFEVTNGITLCKQHHKMIEGSEGIYAELFYKIIKDK